MSATFTPLLTAAEIDAVVAAFYAQVRRHPDLGPVFDAHVTHWPRHEAKIASFWRNVLLRERGYSGNPMQKHLRAGNVTPAHFDVWLGVFDDVLSTSLNPEKAQHWSRLAHRIGQSLRFGLEYAASQSADAPPTLNV